MDMKEKLKQKIKEDKKISIIIGSIICVILCVLITMLVIERVVEVKNESTEITSWLNFGIICSTVVLVVIFIKDIFIVCVNAKKDSDENYEEIKILVKKVSTRMRLLYGTWQSSVLVENLETGEQFTLEGCGDMKENETYHMLRAINSKQFVYERFDVETQK